MSFEQEFRQTLTDAVADAIAKQLKPFLSSLNLNASTTTVNPDHLLTRREAAAYLNLSPITLAIMASQKRGPEHFRIGRSVRYRKSDLDQFLENNRGLVGRKGRPPKQLVEVKTNGKVSGALSARNNEVQR